METQAKLLVRWRYLRGLLLSQLNMLENGTLRIISDETSEAPMAIERIKREIIEFDRLIAESLARDNGRPS